MSLISGLSKFYANSMSALRLIEYHWDKKCLVAFPTIFYANAVRPGFVFIEASILACFRRKNIWLLNIQCPWMIHCTNLKRFPQYLKCPRVNHSITSDEDSPGLPVRGLASLQEARPPFELPQVSPNGWGGGQGHSWKMFKRKQLFPRYDFP